MPKVTLKISGLLLDRHNPRIPLAESQREALQSIIDEQQEKLAALAQSIVDDGLSPADNFLVMRSPDDDRKFIALEGNRRLAALKILYNINVLADLRVGNSLKKRLEKSAREFKAESVEPLSCFELSREEANPWIQRRHIGEDGGRGIVNWNAQATGRFRGEDPALQALKFVIDYGNLTPEQQELLSGRFITTLRRLLESPAVRAELGLDLKKQILSSYLPVEELIKPLKRIVLDLAEKRITVTQLKTKPQMTAYVTGLDASDKPDLSKTIPLQALDELGETPLAPTDDRQGSQTKPESQTRPRQRSRPSPQRHSVVPKPYKLNVANQRALDIYEELKTLQLARHRNAIAILLRVFLELSVDHCLTSIGSGTTFFDQRGNREVDKKLRAKVEECIQHFIQQGEPAREFDPVTRALSSATHPLSPDLLHSYVHNRFSTPLESDLTAAWDNAMPLFERIWP